MRPVLLAGLLAAATLNTSAQDAHQGKQKAQACAPCHGAIGLSVQPDAPNLAGQPAFYLATQLKAYRDGQRSHETMAMMAKTLSDDDIANVSAWFASIKLAARAPR